MKNEDVERYLINVLKNTPKIVKDNLTYNNQILNKRIDFYELKKYIDTFLKNESDNRFFILPGLRGVGKTTILYQVYDYLTDNCKINKNQILYLNLDRLKDFGDLDILKFLDIFIKNINEESYLENKPLFIFVDESQYTHNWALVGKIIYDEMKNVFMIFTGSNALNLELNKSAVRRALKKEIYPLSFYEYLNLKYNYEIPKDLEKSFKKLIFNGEINELEKIEKNFILNVLMDLKRDPKKEWEHFIQYGELPFTINKSQSETIQLTLDMKDRIVEKDMDMVKSFTGNIKIASYNLLNIISLQKPGTLSLEKLANNLNISKKSINNVISTFEEAQLIFHVEPYASPIKRIRKAWEYYFLSTQLKSCIYQQSGQASLNKEYFGLLLENFVGASLFKLKQKSRMNFGIFFDGEKEGVDFLINTIDGRIIPIEVGIGKKNKKQISKAIKRYKADYGIIVSNKTTSIKKEDNIIFIPPITFSLL